MTVEQRTIASWSMAVCFSVTATFFALYWEQYGWAFSLGAIAASSIVTTIIIVSEEEKRYDPRR